MLVVITMKTIIFTLTLIVFNCFSQTSPLVPVDTSSTTNAIKLVIDREEIFPAVINLIENAQEEILLNIYLFGGDDNFTQGPDYIGIGKRIVDILEEKMLNGVRVRIITPKPSSVQEKNNNIQNKLKNQGLEDVDKEEIKSEPSYEPVYNYALQKGLPLLPSNTEVLPGSTLWKIDHSKLLIVDGKEALIGGMNFAETVASNRDAMTLITGPIIKQLKAIFANSWNYSLEQINKHAKKFPEITISPEMKNVMLLAQTDESKINTRNEESIQDGYEAGEVQLTLTSPYIQNSRYEIISRLNSTNSGDQIKIAMLLFTDTELIDAVIAAHKRGVNIKVLLDPNRSLYGVDAKGAPNVLAVKPFIEAGIEVRNFNHMPGQELHMKLMIIERSSGSKEFAMGSLNWTVGALEANYELFAFYKDFDQTTDRLTTQFNQDWRDGHSIEKLTFQQNILFLLFKLFHSLVF